MCLGKFNTKAHPNLTLIIDFTLEVNPPPLLIPLVRIILKNDFTTFVIYIKN